MWSIRSHFWGQFTHNLGLGMAPRAAPMPTSPCDKVMQGQRFNHDTSASRQHPAPEVCGSWAPEVWGWRTNRMWNGQIKRLCCGKFLLMSQLIKKETWRGSPEFNNNPKYVHAYQWQVVKLEELTVIIIITSSFWSAILEDWVPFHFLHRKEQRIVVISKGDQKVIQEKGNYWDKLKSWYICILFFWIFNVLQNL